MCQNVSLPRIPFFLWPALIRPILYSKVGNLLPTAQMQAAKIFYPAHQAYLSRNAPSSSFFRQLWPEGDQSVVPPPTVMKGYLYTLNVHTLHVVSIR